MGCHYMVISTPLVTKEYISTVSPVLFFWLCHPTENLWPLNISGLWNIVQTISMALKDFPQCNHTIVSQPKFLKPCFPHHIHPFEVSDLCWVIILIL